MVIEDDDMDIGLVTHKLYSLSELKKDYKLDRVIHDVKHKHSLFVDVKHQRGHYFTHVVPDDKKQLRYEYICYTL